MGFSAPAMGRTGAAGTAVLALVIWQTAPVSAQDDGAVARTASVLARPNDKASRGHVITLRFDRLPGPVAQLAGTADFEVANRECVPIDYERAPGGVRLPPQHRHTLTFARQGDGSYTAGLFEDQLVDENYYKLGVCRWQLQFVTVRFQSPATAFAGSLSAADLRAGRSIELHYLVRDWTQMPVAAERVFGEGANHYAQSMGPQFTLTIGATKREAR